MQLSAKLPLRVSELCGLRWRDAQERGDAGQVTVYDEGGKVSATLGHAGILTTGGYLHARPTDSSPRYLKV